MSYNNDLTSHFSINLKEYDVIVTISVDGLNQEDKEYILNSIYFDVPRLQYQIHALIPANNIRTIERKILFRKLNCQKQND